MRFSAILSVLVSAVLLSSCSLRPATSTHVDGAYEAYVPANAVFLAGADIDKIRGTDIFQRVVGAAAGGQLESFAVTTGFDPRKDLSSFVSWSDGEKTVTLARGGFSESGLAAKLAAHGLKRTTYKGANLYADDSNSVVVLDSSMVAAGRTAAIHAMLDGYDPARRLPIALAEQLKAVPASSDVWAVFTGGFNHLPGGSGSNNFGNFMQALGGVTGGSMGLDVTRGLGLSARVTCDTNEEARKAAEAARGLIGLGRLSTQSHRPDLAKVFDAIQLRQDQSAVDITATLSQDLADKFLDVWLKKRT